jgi:hypothetical protein
VCYHFCVDASNIRSSLNDLIHKRDEIDEKLVEMNRLLRERDTLQHAIEGLEEVLKLESRDSIKLLPIWQGARQVLRENDAPMSARQLAEALIAMGWRLEGKTPIESLRTTLIRKPDVFERLADGRYTLRPVTSIAGLMSELSTGDGSRFAAALITAKNAQVVPDASRTPASSAAGKEGADAED